MVISRLLFFNFLAFWEDGLFVKFCLRERREELVKEREKQRMKENENDSVEIEEILTCPLLPPAPNTAGPLDYIYTRNV